MSTIDIEVIDAYICSDCGEITEEPGPPLYECPECGEKGTEEKLPNRRCEGCRKFCKKIADQSCTECEEGAIEACKAIRCNQDGCGKLFDPETESTDLVDHFGECFEETLRETIAQRSFNTAEKVAAIKCPWCEKLIEDSEDALSAHMNGDDDSDCPAWKDDQEGIIDDDVNEANKSKIDADKKTAEERAKKDAEKKTRSRKKKPACAISQMTNEDIIALFKKGVLTAKEAEAKGVKVTECDCKCSIDAATPAHAATPVGLVVANAPPPPHENVDGGK